MRAKRPSLTSSEDARSSSLSLHVRARLHRRVSGLLCHRRRIQRFRRPPGQPRCHAFGGVAGALAKLQAYKRRMGWRFPWASSIGSDFNYDFNASYTKEEQREEGIEYNYQHEEPLDEIPSRSTPDGPTTFAAMTGTDVATYRRERPGMSAFALEDGIVYHTYSAYARGLDGLLGTYQWLDRAPRGRNETGAWFRRHDEYNNGRPKSRATHCCYNYRY